MPQLDRWGTIQLGILLLAVPMQYIISTYMSNSTDTQRNFALKRIITNVMDVKSRYLTLSEWQKWCMDLFSNLHGSYEASDDMGESPAIEVLKFRDPEGHFAGSTEPRSPREPHIKYRIGQVVQHKQYGYRGVIVGWDSVAKAPEEWLNSNHPPNRPDLRKGPNYSILVDTRDRLQAQKTYVVEDNIKVISNTKIIHPALDEYFENFDGAQYLPRPWLKKLYPHD